MSKSDALTVVSDSPILTEAEIQARAIEATSKGQEQALTMIQAEAMAHVMAYRPVYSQAEVKALHTRAASRVLGRMYENQAIKMGYLPPKAK